MRVTSDFIDNLFHLDQGYSLLDAQSVRVLIEWFKALDIHKNGALNDIQFHQFVRHITDLSSRLVYSTFDMLDVDGSGEIEPDEFSLLLSILIATKDGEEKQFIYRHSRTVFDLLDEDGSNTISAEEFGSFGFLFNFQGPAIRRIFHEFDISGDQELDYKEFRMFAMACIDAQMELQAEKKRKSEKTAEEELEWSREDRQRMYMDNYQNAMFPLDDETQAKNSRREFSCASVLQIDDSDEDNRTAHNNNEPHQAEEEEEEASVGFPRRRGSNVIPRRESGDAIEEIALRRMKRFSLDADTDGDDDVASSDDGVSVMNSNRICMIQ